MFEPPVGNKCIFDGELIAMVVGGANARTDYHVNQGEEFFYQLKGDVVLKIIDMDKPRDIAIKQGELFWLPRGVPRAPQRPAGSVGPVIEQQRAADELDTFRCHCEHCGGDLYEESFQLEKSHRNFHRFLTVSTVIRNRLRAKMAVSNCNYRARPFSNGASA